VHIQRVNVENTKFTVQSTGSWPSLPRTPMGTQCVWLISLILGICVCLLEKTNSRLNALANTHTHTHTHWVGKKEGKGKAKIREQVSANSLIKQIKLMAAAWLLPTKSLVVAKEKLFKQHDLTEKKIRTKSVNL